MATLKMNPYWPPWLRRSVQCYSGKSKMVTPGDFDEVSKLTEEDCKMIHQVYESMAEVYMGKNPLINNEAHKNNNVGHISQHLIKHEPFKTCQEKYPALYQTMIVWMWG